MPDAIPKLVVRGVSKRFDAAIAVADVDLKIGTGEIIALIGENGAGKSTLLNIISGIVFADAGTMELDGRAVRPANYAEAARLGITRVFQEQALVPNLTVYENLLLSHERHFARFGQLLLKRKAVAAAQAIADEAGLDVDVKRPISACSFSKRQLIEIVRACLVPMRLLSIAHPVVLLDEPTASLDRADEATFFRLIERLRSEASFLFVSHRLSEVLATSDAVVVMKDGQVVSRLAAGEADERQLHGLMVGRDRAADYYHGSKQTAAHGPLALEARGLSGQVFAGIDLGVRRGEILGIGGLLDSGKSELGKGLVGVVPPAAGEVRFNGGDWQAPSIAKALAGGAAYLPAERLVEGVFPDFPVAWNISLAGDNLFSTRLGLWRSRREKATAARMIAELRVRGAAPSTSCRKLSGGNQQKVALGRWLCREIKVLVLDSPTRGIDAGAKEEIYAILRQLTAAGVAIVLITDELLELIGLSDRIAIMQCGRVTAVVDAAPGMKPTEVDLVRLMLPSGAGPTVLAA